jgi:hypothetical protein
MFASLKGYRLLIVSFLVAGLGAIDATGLATVIPAEYVGLVMTGLGLLVGWLRLQTTGPVGQK